MNNTHFIEDSALTASSIRLIRDRSCNPAQRKKIVPPSTKSFLLIYEGKITAKVISSPAKITYKVTYAAGLCRGEGGDSSPSG